LISNLSDCTQSALISFMAALVAAIHVFAAGEKKAWMPGTRPGTNELKLASSTLRIKYRVGPLLAAWP
jgi:hypothetical protein